MLNKKIVTTLLCTGYALHGKNAIIEFRRAGFFPTHQTYKSLYGNTGTYGAEGTFRIAHKYLYGFTSVNFLQQKDGTSLCSPTKVNLIELGAGLKCLVPFNFGDVYAGLGVQPVRVQTKDNAPFVQYKTTKWGFGGIAKFGAFFNMPHNVVLDVFVDYSFVQAKKRSQIYLGFSQPGKAHLNAVIFGAGIGYSFN